MKDQIIKEITIGSRLREKLISCDVSLPELAEAMDCTRQRVEEICTDKAEMTQDEMTKAAAALDTSVDYLSLISNSDIPEEYAQWAREAG